MRAQESHCGVVDQYNALITPRILKPAPLPSPHPLGAASAAGAPNPSGPCFLACMVPGARLASTQDPGRPPAKGGRPCARRRGGWAAQQKVSSSSSTCAAGAPPSRPQLGDFGDWCYACPHSGIMHAALCHHNVRRAAAGAGTACGSRHRRGSLLKGNSSIGRFTLLGQPTGVF